MYTTVAEMHIVISPLHAVQWRTQNFFDGVRGVYRCLGISRNLYGEGGKKREAEVAEIEKPKASRGE